MPLRALYHNWWYVDPLYAPFHNKLRIPALRLQGLYPTIIILLVALRKTHCDQEFSYPSRRRTAVGVESLRFAAISNPRSTAASVRNIISTDMEGGRMGRSTVRVDGGVVEFDGDEVISTNDDHGSSESQSQIREKTK